MEALGLLAVLALGALAVYLVVKQIRKDGDQDLLP